MPGSINSTSPNASFVSDWAIYRAAVAASDDIAHPELVLAVIDLSRSLSGLKNEIWFTPIRNSGTGTLTIAIVLENNGTLFSLKRFTVDSTQAAIANLALVKFQNLMAGAYRAVLTLSATSSWTLHYAITTTR